ncbi:MAG: SIS domain-containing protein [Actinomycetota bacterium]
MGTDLDPVVAGYLEREAVVRSFFTAEADRIARLSRDLATRFLAGGRLLAFGSGAAATDAQHVSVEFVHPVIVGKRALPAIALPNDAASMSAFWTAEGDGYFERHLRIVGRPQDVVLGIAHDEPGTEAIMRTLRAARPLHMLSIALGGGSEPYDDEGVDHVFRVPSADPFVVQEVQETLYHVLWELVHVFFEHDVSQDAAAGDSGFLYPFLEGGPADSDRVLADVAASAVAKANDVVGLRQASMSSESVVTAARRIGERLAAGGKILTMGNGGSATDAQDLAVDALAPPAGLTSLNALSLTADAAVLTAVGNDVGFDNVFARQVIAYGDEADIAIAISTSGGSRNVIAAIEEAKRRGLLTVGIAGYGGGRLAEVCDVSLVVDADYIPRVQEAQATQYHCLRRLLG